MDQQRSALVKHIIKCFSVINLCTPRGQFVTINRFSMTVCWMLD